MPPILALPPPPANLPHLRSARRNSLNRRRFCGGACGLKLVRSSPAYEHPTSLGAALAGGREELRQEWRRLYGGVAPRISRCLLVLAIGYRIQEIEQGGLGKATRRKLVTIAKTLRTSGRLAAAPSLSLKPGARLIREWSGRTTTFGLRAIRGRACVIGTQQYPSTCRARTAATPNGRRNA
jgi:hypothetical protein